MRFHSNFDDFKKLRDALARIDKNKIHSALNSALNSTATQLIPIIKSFTPVKTGLLKSSWNFEVLHGLSGATLVIYNKIFYSLFVEFGHFSRSGTWVRGFFMLTKGVQNAEEILKKELKREGVQPLFFKTMKK